MELWFYWADISIFEMEKKLLDEAMIQKMFLDEIYLSKGLWGNCTVCTVCNTLNSKVYSMFYAKYWSAVAMKLSCNRYL